MSISALSSKGNYRHPFLDSFLGRLSLDTSLDTGTSVEESSINDCRKETWLSRGIAAARRWIFNDYSSSERASYGPPYYEEYGGDLPDSCNQIYADLTDIDELLRNGANPNVGRPEDHELSPIHFAARFGNVKLLEMLEKAGGNLHNANALGLTPLSYACAFKLSINPEGGDALERKQVAAIKWLIQHGADPNHVDKGGYTPLSWACRSGVFPVVVILVEAGADVMQRRPELPGGSQVRLPKVGVLAVTAEEDIRRYLEAQIESMLRKEAALGRSDVEVPRSKAEQDKARLVGVTVVRQDITKRHEAKLSRRSVIREKALARKSHELSLEMMKIQQTEQARKDKLAWLRRLNVSPGIWVKHESTKDKDKKDELMPGRGQPVTSRGARHPRWVLETISNNNMASRKELATHGVLEQARKMEASINRDEQKQEILNARWQAITGKRLLSLEHEQCSDTDVEIREHVNTFGS